MEVLGFELREEAALQTLTPDVVTTSEIEGEKLEVQTVRSMETVTMLLARCSGFRFVLAGILWPDRVTLASWRHALHAGSAVDPVLRVGGCISWSLSTSLCG
jgi:hypothetical protein